MSEDVSHEGIVKNISDKTIEVSIITKAACVSCQMNKVCNPSDAKEKLVEVARPEGRDFSVGQSVVVSISRSMSLLSILLAYISPVVFLFVGFFVAISNGYNENAGAAFGVGAMMIYFLFLYSLRKVLGRKVNFKIQ